MPTIFTHPAVPLAAICSSLPDVDVLAFRFGIPCGAPIGVAFAQRAGVVLRSELLWVWAPAAAVAAAGAMIRRKA